MGRTILWLAGGAVVLLTAAALSTVYWNVIWDASNRWGNFASVLGLFLSVAGFLGTLAALWATRNEQLRTRNAVLEAIRRASSVTMAMTAEELERDIEDFERAIYDKSWVRAAEKCSDAIRRIGDLQEHSFFDENEKSELVARVR